MKIKFIQLYSLCFSLFLVSFLLILLATPVNSQEINPNLEKHLERGETSIDIYYGYGSLVALQFMDFTQFRGFEKSTSFGFGGRIERVIEEDLTISIEGGFVYDSYINQEFEARLDTFTVLLSRSVLRVFPRVNKYFATGKNYAFYASLGLGYRRLRWGVDDNDKSPIGVDPSYSFVAMRLAIGYKFFINKKSSLVLECGIGGGRLINGGVGFKF